MSEALPFDKVEIKRDGAWAPIGVEDWMNTDCAARVEQIMQGMVQFTMNGQKVPTTSALAALRNRK